MNAASQRVFTDEPAVRRSVPLLIGLVGPSGSGKTKSALRLAEGIQRVSGGEVFGIDTEANRMLHYADQHKFRHVPFTAPFDPLSYLAAVEYCVKRGAKTIIIDSASHMHEGPGGTLEAHEAECERLMRTWKTDSRDKVQMSAWQKPKSELRRFLNTVLQYQVNTLWCYRAKEKMKIVPGQQPRPLGFMPIAGDEMIYEMTLNCLLPPNSVGVPSWHPEEMGERAVIKLPEQFRQLFSGEPRQLDEDTGAQLAKWAAGGVQGNPAVDALLADYAKCTSQEELKALEDKRGAMWKKTPAPDKQRLKEASEAAQRRLQSPKDSAPTSGSAQASNSSAPATKEDQPSSAGAALGSDSMPSISIDQATFIRDGLKEQGVEVNAFCARFQLGEVEQLPADQYNSACAWVDAQP